MLEVFYIRNSSTVAQAYINKTTSIELMLKYKTTNKNDVESKRRYQLRRYQI